MTEEIALTIIRQALFTTVIMAGPFLALIFVIGFVISFLLSLFQLSETSLQFIPKWLAVLALSSLVFSWEIKIWSRYIHELFVYHWHTIVAALS